MKTPVFMTGYEVWRKNTDDSELILYTCESVDATAPQSLYDVTLGMYMKGLINHKDEQRIAESYNHAGEFIYWSVLEHCKTQLSIAEDQPDGLNGGTYKYDVENGDFVDANGVKVSAFVKNGTVYLIAHVHSLTDDPAYKNWIFNGGGSKEKQNTQQYQNYLNDISRSYNNDDEIEVSVNFDSPGSGVFADTIVIDAGIDKVDNYALRYLGFTNVIYNDGITFGSVQFSKTPANTTVVPFSKTSAKNANFAQFEGICDMSCAVLENLSSFTENPQFTELILPSVSDDKEGTKQIVKTFIMNPSSGNRISSIYAANRDKVDNTVDLRGTEYYVKMSNAKVEGKYIMVDGSGKAVKVFKNVFVNGGAQYLIQKEEDGYYKYTWVGDVAADENSGLAAFTRDKLPDTTN